MFLERISEKIDGLSFRLVVANLVFGCNGLESTCVHKPMNPKVKLVFIASICLNAALAAGFLINRAVPQNASQSPLLPTTAARSAIKSSRADRVVQTVMVDREKALDWATVESADYRAYIENLRSIGCPEETVRDIIIADINKLYASKVAALYPSAKEFKFWRVEDRVAKNEERGRDKQRHELEQEKRELIKELLGVDYESEIARWSGRPNDDTYRYGFLSSEKQEQTKALHDKYRELERELLKDGGGWTPENRAKFMALRGQREAEMAQLLGPEDFEQYQLRNSYTARNMRENLTGFQPSEAEFRQIFQMKKAYDDQFAFSRDGSDDAVREERKLAQQNLEAQLKATLGAERFHEYELSQNEGFREAYDFTQRYDLPKQTAETLFQVRAAAEQERQRIRNDRSLNEQARTAALKGLADATRNALEPALGKDNFGKYVARSSWITRLDEPSNSSRNRGDKGSRIRDVRR
jgi:hypothetical protein